MCELCQNQFVKWSSLARHSKSLHGIVIEVEVNNAIKLKRRDPKAPCKKMECEKCGKGFKTPHRMLGHLRTHLGLKVIQKVHINDKFANKLTPYDCRHMRAMSVALATRNGQPINCT